jgi:hypothetical protein
MVPRVATSFPLRLRNSRVNNLKSRGFWVHGSREQAILLHDGRGVASSRRCLDLYLSWLV